METVVVSKATKWAQKHISKMHMDMLVVEVTYFQIEVRFDLRGYFEAVVASGGQKRPKP